MAEFFHLNSQDIENPANAEDKVISREQRIFADNVIFAHGDTYKVKTTSTAYRQKLKFFVDVVEYTNPDTQETFKYRCGYYYECEHYESVRLFTSLGFMSFYFVIDRIANGEFDFAFYISNENVKLYVSSVVFEDSFYNPEKGWLNPNNPDNIIDELVDDDNPDIPTIPGYSGGGNNVPYIVWNGRIPGGGGTVGSPQVITEMYEDSFCRIWAVKEGAASYCTYYFGIKDDYAPVNFANSEYNIKTIYPTNLLTQAERIIGSTSWTTLTTPDGLSYRGFVFNPLNYATPPSYPYYLYSNINTTWNGRDGFNYNIIVNHYTDIQSGSAGSYYNNVRLTVFYGGRHSTNNPPV